MSGQPIYTKRLDYIQRNTVEPGSLPSDTSRTKASIHLRKQFLIKSVGEMKSSFLQPDQNKNEKKEKQEIINPRLISEDILTGLYGFRIPLIYIIRGSGEGIKINFGTWSTEKENATESVLESRLSIIGSSLHGQYPGIDIDASDDFDFSGYTHAGFVLGIPTVKRFAEENKALPFDRIIRAMSGSPWACLIMAEAITEKVILDVRNTIINEIRFVKTQMVSENAPDPLAEHYIRLLEADLIRFTTGQTIGTWRTAVYLLGDKLGYYKLASLWKGVFSGDNSVPEPINVFENKNAIQLAAAWAMSDMDAEVAPERSLYKHIFQHQTVLNANQLAAYMHLPAGETCGFGVNMIADFDVERNLEDKNHTVHLGKIKEHGKETQSDYSVSYDDINKHILVAGVTGCGKTNTLFHILLQLWEKGIPFLVLEPAKTEYRALSTHPLFKDSIQVFTLGDENVSPIRINPFEVDPGVSVSTHIDLLKSVFNASFGMWDPLPQVLERSIIEVYSDFGWDTIRGVNHRIAQKDHFVPESFPTLSSLYEKSKEIVETLGYEEKIMGNIKSALLTRLNSLRIGSKGIMLDSHHSVPLAELLKKPTIIELEQIGDDDEKAFLMGLILMKVYEHLRITGSFEGAGLKHVIVVEEAHRLLANIPQSVNQEQSNSKGKAVESFSNMLSEIRAYGEGFFIADQIPVKLAPDIIKNTNIKITHRIVAGDDRKTIGESINLEERQFRFLPVLEKGEAVVFAEGDDRPVLVKVPYRKQAVPDPMKTKKGSDELLTAFMKPFREQDAVKSLYQPFPVCNHICKMSYEFCDTAKTILDNDNYKINFARFVLAIAHSETTLREECLKYISYVKSFLPLRKINLSAILCTAMNSIKWYFEHFGRKYNWEYDLVDHLKRSLSINLLEAISGISRSSKEDKGQTEKLESFKNMYLLACASHSNPYPVCPRICPDNSCVFKYHNELLLNDREYSQSFNEEMNVSVQEQKWPEMKTMRIILSRMGSGIESVPALRSLGLCFHIQKIYQKHRMTEDARLLASNLIINAFDKGFKGTDQAEENTK